MSFSFHQLNHLTFIQIPNCQELSKINDKIYVICNSETDFVVVTIVELLQKLFLGFFNVKKSLIFLGNK